MRYLFDVNDTGLIVNNIDIQMDLKLSPVNNELHIYQSTITDVDVDDVVVDDNDKDCTNVQQFIILKFKK